MMDENSKLFFDAVDLDDISKINSILLNESINIWQIMNKDNLTGKHYFY